MPAALLALLLTAPAAQPAFADQNPPESQSPGQLDQQLSQYTDKVHRLSDELEHAQGRLDQLNRQLADSGLLAGVIDITTTEVCDLLFGGVLPATKDRFGAIARTKLPYVGSVGALDMVNFWAPPLGMSPEASSRKPAALR